MTLPKAYAWLANEPGPRILKEMLALYGTIEKPGKANNPLILAWAKEIGLGHVYKADSIAWCGLTVAFAAARAGWDYAPRGNALGARNWLAWGRAVVKPELGNVLVFWRGSKGGFQGHVGIYVGEDAAAYHVLGGNQGDRVSIKRIVKSRLLGARECPWKVDKPDNIRRVMMTATGPLSANEA